MGAGATRKARTRCADVYVPATSLVNNGGQAVATASATAAPARRPARPAAPAHAARPTAPPVSPNPALRNASTGNVLSNTPTHLVPLSAIARFVEGPTATSVNHQDAELATTISFNLAEGATLDDAQAGDRAGRGRHRHADQRARQLRRARRCAAQQIAERSSRC